MNTMTKKITYCLMIGIACLSRAAWGMGEEYKWNDERTPEQVQKHREKLVLKNPLPCDDPIEVDTLQRQKKLKQLLYDLLTTLPREITDLIGDYDISDSAADITFDKAKVSCAKCVHNASILSRRTIQSMLGLREGFFVIAVADEDEQATSIEVYDVKGKLIICFPVSFATIHALVQLSDDLFFVAGRGKDEYGNDIKAIESQRIVCKNGQIQIAPKNKNVKHCGYGAIVGMIAVGGDIKAALVYGCHDGEIVFYVPLNDYKRVLKNKGAAITAITNIGKQGVVAAATADGKVALFNCRAPKNEQVLIKAFDVQNVGEFWDNSHPITVLIPLEDNELLVGSSASSMMQHWSLKTGKPQDTLNIKNIKGVQKLSNGLWIIGFKDGAFRLFNPKTKKEVPLSLKESVAQEMKTVPTHFTVLQQPRDWLVTAHSEEFKLWR